MSNQQSIFDLQNFLIVETDKSDYAPGEFAIFTATGVTTGGTVEFQVLHVTDPGADGTYGTLDDVLDAGPDQILGTVDDGYGTTGEGHEPFYVTDGGEGDLDGEANGVIVTNWYVNPDDSLNEMFLLTARGVDGTAGTADDSYVDGAVATTSFTDASGDFSIDFAAAAPFTYNHLTGGGAYNDRTVGVNDDIVESLEGGNFACGDIITYFAVVTVDNTSSAINDGPQTIEMDFSFLADTTGQSGVAIGDIVLVQVNYGAVQNGAGPGGTDSGIIDDGGSTATLISESLTGPLFTAGSELLGTVELNDLEAGEQVVVRIDVKLFCDPGSNPTGNLQGALEDIELTFINGTTPVDPPETVPGGKQTIPFKQIGNIAFPELDIQKTVRLDGTSDPFVETLTDVVPGGLVEYQYVVSNPGGAPLYNVVVVDDNATPGNTGDDFPVTLSGLTDVDGDGDADDLAAGATATGTATTAADGLPGGSRVNTGTATGDDSIIQPTELSDTDTATVEFIDFVENPAYTITKTVTDVGGDGPGGSVNAAGDVISYQIAVANTGNTFIDGVVVTDQVEGGTVDTLTLVSGDTDSDGRLDADETIDGVDTDADGKLDSAETWIYNDTYTAQQSDIDNNGGGDGTIDNTATVDSNQLDELSDSASVSVVQNPALAIEKQIVSVDPDGDGVLNEAGDIINYKLVVTNTGNQTLTNVVVTDPLTGVNTTLASLAPDAVEEITASYAITQADIDSNATLEPDNVVAGQLDNTAKADSDQTDEVSDSEQEPIVPGPALAIEKQIVSVDPDGDGVLNEAGDIINYKLVVTNTGNQTLTNVVVTDPLTGVNTTLASLAPDAVEEITASYAITQADIDSNATLEPDNVVAGQLDNTAKADSDQTDEVSDSEQEPIVPGPALAIEKQIVSVDPDGDGVLNEAGDIINYKLVVTNTGNQTLTNVVVTDPLTGVNTTLASLAPDAVEEITASYAITQADIDSNATLEPDNVVAGQLDNTAKADSDQTDEVSDSEQEPIVPGPALAIEKQIVSVDPDGDGVLNEAGDIINYKLVVTNTGNQTLTNVVVTDPLTGVNTTLASLAPDAVEEITASYAITQADIDSNATLEPDNVVAGQLDNTAKADSDQTDEVSDSEQEPIVPGPALAIEKQIVSVDPDGDGVLNEAGDIINYKLVVTNTGNQTLTNVVVTDPLTGVNTTLASLAPDAVEEITASYAITQADIDSNATLEPDNVVAGQLDNTAKADSDQTDEVSDSEQEPIVPGPALAIEKQIVSVDPDGDGVLNEAGDIINYKLVVTNTGNQTLTNVVVTDPLTGVNTTLASLAPDAVEEITASYAITQADIDSNATLEPDNVVAGQLDNTAKADSDQTDEVSDSEQEPIVPGPALAIEKLVSIVKPGEFFEGAVCEAFGKPVEITFLYDPGTMVFTSQDSGKAEILVNNGIDDDGTSFIAVSDQSDANKALNGDGKQFFRGDVPFGDGFIASEFFDNDDFGSTTYIHFFDDSTGGLLQSVKYHTSCSQPILLGDVIGNATLVGYTGESGTAPVNPPVVVVGPVDADDPTGPIGQLGDMAVFTYEVTNSGNMPLSDVKVNDNQGLTPDGVDADEDGFILGDDADDTDASVGGNSILDPGETWIFTASTSVKLGQQTNIGTVTAETGSGQTVSDDDPANYAGVETPPAINIEKLVKVEGFTPMVNPVCETFGKPVAMTFTYDAGANPDSVMTEQDPGKAEAMGTVDDDGVSFIVVSRESDRNKIGDPTKNFFMGSVDDGQPFTAEIDIPGPGPDKFESNTYFYVFDDESAFTGGKPALQTMQYHTSCSQPINLGDVIGTLTLSGYGGENGEADFTDLLGEDADTLPGPEALIGSAVKFAYLVANPGGTSLDVEVTDDNKTPNNPNDDFMPAPVLKENGGNFGDDNDNELLDPGETWFYTASETAQEGLQTNRATVKGMPTDDAGNPLGLPDVMDDDPANYTGTDRIVPEGDMCDLGDPLALTFIYRNPDDPDYTDVRTGGKDNDGDGFGDQDGKAKIRFDGGMDDDGVSFIVVSDENDPDKALKGDGKQFFRGDVDSGKLFTASEDFDNDSFGSQIYVHSFDDDGSDDDGPGLLQSIEYHTSCSQPIQLGDEIGSVSLFGYEGESGSDEILIA